MTTVTLEARTYTEERLLTGFHAALGEWRTAQAAYGTQMTRHVHETIDRWLASGVLESDPKMRMWQEPRFRLTAHDPVRLRRALVEAAGQNLARTADTARSIQERTAKLAEDGARLAALISKAAEGTANYKAVCNAASTVSMTARAIERLRNTEPGLAEEAKRINRMCRAAGFDREAVWAGRLEDTDPDSDLNPLGGDD